MGLLDQMSQGAPIAPQLAEAAAGAGAPAPGAGQAPPQGAPPGPPQGAPQGAPSGPPQGVSPQGAPPQQAGAEPPVERVDPAAEAVPGEMIGKLEQATPDEQAAYARAMQYMSKILYGDRGAKSIVDQIDPNDKVSSTTKAGVMIVQQMDKKLQMDQGIVAEITKEASTRIMELAEARHSMEYGGREAQVIVGATWEGVQELFGTNPEEGRAFLESYTPEELEKIKQQREGFVNG